MAKSNAKGKTWKRGARPGNYTDMQRMIGCLIAQSHTGQRYSGENAWNDGATCSFGKQAAIKLGYLPYGSCGPRTEGGPKSGRCEGVTGNAGGYAAKTKGV